LTNTIYIATSIDGYIADKFDSTEFLSCIENPQNEDLGTSDFFDSVDCLLMGRNTYETVIGFGGDWPYPMPVFVMSSHLQNLNDCVGDNVQIINGEVEDVLSDLRAMGYVNIYVDGGSIIKQFLAKDLIDEMIITTVPILLGGGTPLFGAVDEPLKFDLIDSKIYLNQLVSSHYRRKRD
jgi:dihydrofolate reductase